MIPACSCHGAAMKWNRDTRGGRTGGYWRCAVKHRAQIAGYMMARRDRDPVFRYEGQLKERRRKALLARSQRQLRKETEWPATGRRTRQTFAGTASAAA